MPARWPTSCGETALDFEVDFAENLSKEAMRKAFDRFYGKIKSGSVALVFFSGYAIQSARQSYIIPVDGQIWTEADVRRDGVSLEYDPQGNEYARRQGQDRRSRCLAAQSFRAALSSGSAGLAPVDAPTGSLVMYSSAPSTVVNDTGSEHRLFVNEIVKPAPRAGIDGRGGVQSRPDERDARHRTGNRCRGFRRR